MKKSVSATKKIDSYISKFPEKPQKALTAIRKKIHTAVPEAEEYFTYGVPTFKCGRQMLNYAGFTSHIGLYPGPDVIIKYKKELSPYSVSKGTIRFPLDKKIPMGLIVRIASYRLRCK